METKTNSSEKHASSESIKIPVKWIVSTIVTIVVIVLAYFLLNSGIMTGNASSTDIGENEAKEKLLDFFSTQVPESSVEFVSISKQGTFYEIILNVDGQEVPVFVTSDGKYLVVDPIPLE